MTKSEWCKRISEALWQRARNLISQERLHKEIVSANNELMGPELPVSWYISDK